MTAVTSTLKNKSFFGQRFRNKLIENKRTAVVICAMAILGLPLLALMTVIDEGASYDSSGAYHMIIDTDPYMTIGVICTIIGVLSGIVVVHGHFNYLYNKSLTDMNYALPLNTRQRFFADYLAGLSMYTVPMICSIILFVLIIIIGHLAYDFGDNFWQMMGEFVKISVLGIVGMTLMYTLCTLAVMFCGSTFESNFSIVAINGLIPAVMACVWFAVESSSSFGMDDISIVYNSLFNFSNPVGYLFFVGRYINYVDYDSSNMALYFRGLISTLVMIAVYIGIAYILYKFRKAEDVSKPYVYKWYYYLIMTCATFCVISLFIYNDESPLAGILLCAIGWFIMEIVTRRGKGFKKFWTAGVTFAGSVAAVLLVCNICSATDGFGASKHVPSKMSVSSVEISINGANGYIDRGKYKDRDVISAVVDLQKNVVDRYFNPDDYTYKVIGNTENIDDNYINVTYSIEIVYNTISGSAIAREYSVTGDIVDTLFEAILLSDDYSDSVKIQGNYYGDYRINNKSVRFEDIFGYSKGVPLSDESIKELDEAYRADLEEMTADDLKNSTVIGQINGEYFVLDTFSRTKSFLEKNNIECTIDKDDILACVDNNDVAIMSNPVFYSYSIMLYSDNKTRDMYYGNGGDEICELDKVTFTYVPYSMNNYMNDSNYGLRFYNFTEDEYVEDLTELVSNSTSIIIGEKPIGFIRIKDSVRAIPDRGNNRELMKKLLGSSYWRTGGEQDGWDSDRTEVLSNVNVGELS